jgi:anaerobic selenocysteine-containing dehydrogenase
MNSGEITRREFLKIVGVTTALATMGGVLTEISLIATEAEKRSSSAPVLEGKEELIPTTCSACVNFCGIKVKVVDGVIRAVYPDENRADIFNKGLCPKGVVAPLYVYNPYRIKAPLKRTNPEKGPGVDPKWVEISWDEAFNIITERLKKIMDEDPRKFIWQHGHGKYLIQDKFPKAFAKAFGTPNVVHRTTICEAARHVADELTWGYHGILPDLEYTRLLINFGANYTEAEQWARWLDHALMDAKERGMKLIVVEPRLSNLAAKADEWVPIRPGKDVVFLLAMANVLINEGYIDEDFLINYTNAPYLVGEDGKILRDTKNIGKL